MHKEERSVKKLAKYEIGWWKAHHKRNYPDVLKYMAGLYSELFGLPYESALRIVKLRIDAGKFHDKAEKLEDKGKIHEAEKYWKKAENSLKGHFQQLLQQYKISKQQE